MKPEVGDAETEVQPGVQARGGEAGEERGVSAAQAARDLDVHETVLRKWVKEFAVDPDYAFPGRGQVKPEQQEIDRSRREVARLRLNGIS